ncbi:hypothetical protein [Anabaena sp. CCY 0017]|uniref:hypothetical protein n=1 Tax=Anabaena sp. CCY 0017 TaxID=3103866 RepID=UPI0039C7017D
MNTYDTINDLGLLYIYKGEPDESLIAWDKWSDAEAFTGKYTYKFKENPTFDMKYIEITASGGEVICLDDSLSFWNDS